MLREITSNVTIRLRDEAYAFLAMLDGQRTVAELWDAAAVYQGEKSLTQGEVIQVFGQLYTSNFLRCDIPADSALIFQRFAKKRSDKFKSSLSNILFFRFRVVDPDTFFSGLANFFGRLFSWQGLAIWVLILAFGAHSVVKRWDELGSEFNSLLDPANLFYLYLSFAIIKLIHECGHGVACKWLGRNEAAHEVRTLGVMLLVLMPMPYVDVSSCWMFRSKWKRILVSLGGMYVELLAAAFAGILWTRTGDGTLLHSLSYNVMVTASIGTILFNANPLMRFDGYYALVDWLELPNLYTASSRYLIYLVKRILWAVQSVSSPAHSLREAAIYSIYGVLSLAWRVWISAGIILFVADKYFFVGMIMAIISIFMWVVIPTVRLFQYLSTSPELEFHRFRAAATTVTFLFGFFLLVGCYKFGDHWRVEGTVQPLVSAFIYAGADGYLEYCLEPGTRVHDPGTVLARIHNPSIDAEIQSCEEELNSIAVQIRLATQEQRLVDVRLFEARKQAFLHKLDKVQKEQTVLQVKTSLQGAWEAQKLDAYLGSWVNRGQILGKVLGPETIRLRVIVDQDEAARLFSNQDFTVSYRVAERPDIGGSPMSALIERIIPVGSNWLPSNALGYLGGGHQAIDEKSGNGQKTLSNVFEVWMRPTLPPGDLLFDGQRVIVRFAFPETPLATQWLRKIQQLLSKRYVQK